MDVTKAIVEETVDALMATHPETLPVFTAFGVDTCCGAHRSVRVSAVEDGCDEAALVEALQNAMAGTP